MQGPSNNGFGWNNELKCTVAEKDEFDNWVKVRCLFLYSSIIEAKLNFIHFNT